MSSLISVAILERHTLSRLGMAAILTQAKEAIKVTGTLAHASGVEACLHDSPCDVLLVDDAFVDGGLEALLLHLKRHAPHTAAIVLSQKLHRGYVQSLLAAGARGFVYKAEERLEEGLLMAIRAVVRGELYLSPRVSLLPYEADSTASDLTCRDLYVLERLAAGQTIKEIADALHLDTKMIYRSRDRLREGLGVRTNEQIVSMAHAKGWL